MAKAVNQLVDSEIEKALSCEKVGSDGGCGKPECRGSAHRRECHGGGGSEAHLSECRCGKVSKSVIRRRRAVLLFM